MDTKQQLLYSWMELSMVVKGNRFLKGLSNNEMFILSILNREENSSASDLCRKMNLFKSQMNHILSQMQEKGWIEQLPSAIDKRKTYISLTQKGKDIYKQEHKQVMKVIDKIYDNFGQEKTQSLSSGLSEAIELIKGDFND